MYHASAFTGSIPELYERYLGPVLFEPYAVDLAARIGRPVSELLELACGTGRLTTHLLPKLAESGRLLATDLNADMLRVAEEQIRDKRLTWEVADAGRLPFADDRFDLAACQFGVMFFPDKVAAFKEVFRVLQPGGTWLFNTWDALAFNPRAKLVQLVLDRVFGADKHAFTTKGPYSYQDPDAIWKQLAEAGFTDIEIEFRAIVSRFQSADDFVKGFIDGSTLASFLSSKAPAIQEQVRMELSEGMRTLDMELEDRVPMQALIVRANKPA